MPFAPDPPQRLETARLSLRPWDPTDAPALHAALAASRDHLAPWLAWARDEPAPLPELAARLRRFRAFHDLGTDLILGIFDRASGALLGGSGWHPGVGAGAAEIGYWVDVRHTGRGIATEAAAALTVVGLTHLPWRKLELRVIPENAASAGIPRRLGYRLDGVLRAAIPGAAPTDPWRPAEVHSLLREELAGSPAEDLAGEVRVLDALGHPLPPPGATKSARE